MCTIMHESAVRDPRYNAPFAGSCQSLRFSASNSKGIRNPMLYPFELRALFIINNIHTSPKMSWSD